MFSQKKFEQIRWGFNIIVFLFLSLFSSCKDYLDLIPDNIPTIDNAFSMRTEAEKYLYTCYSYMPKDGNLEQDVSLLGGDEIWVIDKPARPNFNHLIASLARGTQSSGAPVGDGLWSTMFRALRDCNIFLDNIGRVKDLSEQERNEWIAEVKFLKAYYHFFLVRMYGPIPLIRENLPLDVDLTTVKISRAPVDECFGYIVKLLNEAKDNLPAQVSNPEKMLGRITKPIVYALKAKVLMTAASPLFNGNTDQATLRNKDGLQLFNQQSSLVKWDSARVACKEAIDVAISAGHKLYTYNPTVTSTLSDDIKTQLSLRLAFTERWNSEIIWANTQSLSANTQRMATPNVNPLYQENPNIGSELAPPLKIVDQFYTKNGLPTNEDPTWNQGQQGTRPGTSAEQRFIRLDYETSLVNFNREPRFYASLGFDGGVWFGQGVYNDATPSSLFFLAAKKGQVNGKSKPDYGSMTGYFIKKFVHYQNTQTAGISDYTVTNYPWPLIRLSQLYLMYAEALNEFNGPSEEVYANLNIVRARAGIPTLQASWASAINPGKIASQVGLKDIIHQEELIELAFEGSRFWDLRRWKESITEYRKPIQGWDIDQSTTALYYRRKLLFNQRFILRDYFWPINDAALLANGNLVQNIGW